MYRHGSSSAHPGDVNILKQAVHQTRGAFGTVALFSLCMNLLVLAGPIYMLQIYDRVLGSYKVETLILLTVMLAAAFGAWAALDGLRTGITVRLGEVECLSRATAVARPRPMAVPSSTRPTWISSRNPVSTG